jgi:hypothetical protein
MLYEKKRTFAREPIALSDGTLTVGASVYAGQALGVTSETATYLDFEAENQHFPEENTLEVLGSEDADSVADGATVTFTLQSSADASSWKDELSFPVAQAEIVKDQLIRRFTIPAQARRYMRLKLVVGAEVFTAGKVLAFVRPL